MAEALRIGDPQIEILVRRHARARRIILRCPGDGRPPILTLPPTAPLKLAQAFLDEKEPWLRARMAAAPVKTSIEPGMVIPFRGGELRVVACHKGGVRREADTLFVPGRESTFPRRVCAWIKEAARSDCMEYIDRVACDLGRHPRGIALRDPRSRWGSCTENGDLMFSWRLVLAPTDVLEYVVVHEMAHLVEMNHSRRFWAVVEKLMPRYSEPRAWLRKNGSTLHAINFSYRPPNERVG